MSAVDEVRRASDKFYSAINGMVTGDSSPMSDVWSHSETVTTMHPLGGEQIGWTAVRESFEQVAGIASSGRVQLVDQIVEAGTDLAYEVGVERGEAKLAGENVSIEQRVTNVYRLEAGQWKMVHHHTDISPAMVELAQRLRAA